MGAPNREPSSQDISRDDLKATLAARQELGAEFEPALVESLADRLEGVIEARVDARLAQRPPATVHAVPAAAALSPRMRLTLALGSMGIAVFATAAAGDFTGLPGVVVVWTGVVLVNVAAAFSPRGQR